MKPMPDDHLALLRSHFGFGVFRPGQQEAIRSLFENQHTLVVMPTGAGKSLIFQFASLEFPGVTLVISPLIALMKDQVDSLTRRQIPATYINSTLPAAEQIERLKKLANGQYRLVYVAPERLRNSSFQDAIHRQPISLLAVDEAHCISEWGHDFRPDYLHIAQARVGFGNPLTVALTATATPRVQNDILRLLGMKDSSTRIVTGFNRANLSLNVTYTNGLPAKLRALKELLSTRTSGSVIIYAGTRRDVEEVAEFVRDVVQMPAEYYHAGVQNDERSRIQNEFIGGKLNVIVATNAFGMGIDRADVRQVIHYSMPGSLEAYYQEAGRAGRDELPARVTLLYDPQDRALHEFFIQQSELAAGDLLTIHNTFRKGESSTTVDDLSRMTGFHPVQLLIGLSVLESTGGLEHLGDDGTRKMYRKGAWAPLEIEKAIRKSKDHLQLRQNQLSSMVDYAESNACRRKIILKHFGDAGKAEAADCCDNCRASSLATGLKHETTGMSQAERATLIILDCIRRLKIKVGQGKLAQILHGSRAQDILKFQYDKNVYYGRLATVKQSDIEAVIGQLLENGYIKSIGGEYPILSLTPRGENAIREKESILLEMPKSFGATEIRRAKEKIKAGSTLEYTAGLFAQGLKPEQIAHERGLSTMTIYTHLAELITAGRILITQVVPAEKIIKIEAAIQQVGSADFLAPLKEVLPDEMDYNLIRCVVAEHRKQKTDPITSFLESSHPRPLAGSWQYGWSLGFHSRFSGGDWARSGVGDLTFRLKYEGDISVLPALVTQTLDLIRMHPEMNQVDAILPVPPSIQRPTDPVQAFCSMLAEKTGIPMQTCVIKIRQTQPQKELKTLTQKRANVSGAFALRCDVSSKRILLVDDLFDSGATLDEITRLLKQRGAGCVNVLTFTRTIHSDT
jgi:ATP-dependent DNA helicase RecQ